MAMDNEDWDFLREWFRSMHALIGEIRDRLPEQVQKTPSDCCEHGVKEKNCCQICTKI